MLLRGDDLPGVTHDIPPAVRERAPQFTVIAYPESIAVNRGDFNSLPAPDPHISAPRMVAALEAEGVPHPCSGTHRLPEHDVDKPVMRVGVRDEPGASADGAAQAEGGFHDGGVAREHARAAVARDPQAARSATGGRAWSGEGQG